MNRKVLAALLVLALATVVAAPTVLAQASSGPAQHGGGEASLKIPDLGQVHIGGIGGRTLLTFGLGVCVLGLVFGLVIFSQLKNLPVHESMREISELIYETCKTYLITQGKFILLLEVFIGFIIVVYFGFLQHFDAFRVLIILLFSLIGIAGSYGVAWFGIRINTFANSRTAFASLRGEAFPVYAIPLKAGMSIGMLLISVELFLMLCILLFIPGDYAGPCFIGFAMRVLMIVASGGSYLINEAIARGRYAKAARMNFEAPLTSLVWLTSIVSVVMTYAASYVLIPSLGDGSLWWKLSTVITCGTLAGAIIPELVKIFTSTESSHVREVVTASREGGASLNVLSGFVAGNFSAYRLGMPIVVLMGTAFLASTLGMAALTVAAAVFALGLVAFGFLGMGPVTIAVDSYGPVTDNAQSVYELSVIETIPTVAAQIR